MCRTRLRYAALELREAIEALTYDRALAYEKEIPPAHYETWQPRKVLEFLIDIDPMAASGPQVKVGKEEEYGKPPKEMADLGKETVFDLADIKKHYDALGSYLHKPTWKQLREGKLPDPEKLRSRCDQIASKLDAVLASPIFNVTLGSFAEMPCRRCAEPVPLCGAGPQADASRERSG